MARDTPTTPPHAALTEIELCAWIGQAAPGDVLEYHRGFLALDTTAIAIHIAPNAREELARVAKRAMQASEQDLVHLVQKRRGPNDFSYLAIARPKPRHASASIAALLLEDAA